MCGFVVTTDIENCAKMMERQQFRGPDGMAMWKNDKIAMAHALLDISGKKQLQPYKTKKETILYSMEKCMIQTYKTIQSI